MTENRANRFSGAFGAPAIASPPEDVIAEAVVSALEEVDAFAASASMMADLPDQERAAVMAISNDLLLGKPGAAEDTPIFVEPWGALAMLPGADWLIPFGAIEGGVKLGPFAAWSRVQESTTKALILKAANPPDDDDRLSAERALARLITEFFAGQLVRLTTWLEDKTAQAATALGGFFEAELAPMVRALLPFYDQWLSKAAQQGLSASVAVDWALINDAVLNLSKSEAAKLAAELNRTTQAQAAKIIADWIETGGTMPELVQRLEMLYPRNRAEMIGVTEVTRLYANGNIAAWKASEVVTGYRWQTAADDKVCPICGPRDGEVYDLDSGIIPPAHPRCRCWVTPEVD